MKYPLNIYMSPRNAIARFNALIAKYGLKQVAKSDKFKEEKELLTTGLFMLGIQKFNGHKYFIRPYEDLSLGIDIRAITWGSSANPIFQAYDIQVTEFESNSTNLIDVILKKIRKQ